MTVLEHIKQLSHSLTPKQREDLAKYLGKPNGKPVNKKPVILRDSWKIDFPTDFFWKILKQANHAFGIAVTGRRLVSFVHAFSSHLYHFRIEMSYGAPKL